MFCLHLVSADGGESSFLAILWGVLLFLLLIAYGDTLNMPASLTGVIETGYPLIKLLLIAAGFGLLFAPPAYLLVWLWSKDFSFVSPLRSPVWEQTAFTTSAGIIGFTGYYLLVRTIRKLLKTIN
ncbi:MAG: hypothetical protein ACK4UN_13050 [Limisphaerales bacterium]